MKFLNKIFVGVMALALFSGCVDDFQDANPPQAFDSPYFILNVDKTQLFSDQTVELTLSVLDAPGKIESVEFALGEGQGSVTLDDASFNAAKGQETGNIKATFNPPQTIEGTVSINVTLFDAQGDNQKSHQQSVNLEVNHACTGRNIAGTYDGVTCEDSTKQVTVTENGSDFNVSDITAGTFGAGVDIAAVLSCGGGLLSAPDVSVDTFDVSNIVGEVAPDGSILLNWTVNTPNTGFECSTELLLP